MVLSPGHKLGPYEVVSPIGEGGMGEVWRARDSRLGREVAIKVSKTEYEERFGSEARAIAAFNHPNICQLYDVGPNYLVMELVEGSKPRGPMDAAKAVALGRQVLDALDAAHRKGFTHRDLKPDNILLTRQGVKLLDFGLAKRSTSAGEMDPTQTADAAIVGTLPYMAPELLEGKPADARSDLFAFGCVLFELLSGKRAFPGGPTPTGAPPALERVIQTCLATDPDDRFQTATDLKRALDWAMMANLEPPPAKARARWWLAAAAIALLAGSAGGWMLARRKPAPEANARPVRLELMPPEDGQFRTDSISVSPDGRTIAFVSASGGKSELWIRPLDSGSATRVPGTDGAYLPFWSPDSRSVGYFAQNRLWRNDLSGGAPVTLSENVPLGRGAAWHSDGTIVFGTFGVGLRRIQASGGTAEMLMPIDFARGDLNYFTPQFVSGQQFLFWTRNGTDANTGVYVASLANPKERSQLTNMPVNALYAAGHLLTLRGNALVAQRLKTGGLQLTGEPVAITQPVGYSPGPGQMTASASDDVIAYSEPVEGQLRWLDRSGKPLGKESEIGSYQGFQLSPDGSRIVAARNRGSLIELWMSPAEGGAWSRFTFLPGITAFAVWSPDGRNIVFRSGLSRNMFRKSVDGSGQEERISESGNNQYPTDWSQDGKVLIYHEPGKETRNDLWILPVLPDGTPDPAGKPRAYLRTPADESYGRLSPEPNPRWLVHASDESGREEIYLQAFPEPRGKLQLSTAGGRFPVWSRNGREVFFVSPDNKLMSVSLRFGPGGVEQSAPRELFTLPAERGISVESPYNAAADGQRFLVRTAAGQKQPLHVILNWQALLATR